MPHYVVILILSLCLTSALNAQQLWLYSYDHQTYVLDSVRIATTAPFEGKSGGFIGSISGSFSLPNELDSIRG